MAVRMVVIGDSVPWGQGLLLAQKFHEQVRLHLAIAAADVLHLAHSGATIQSTMPSPPAVDGEVPKFFPTITEQCRTAASQAASAELVLLNGGLNDVDFRFILNPFTDRRDLVNETRRHCHIALAKLLRLALESFPGATIIVTGYYAILSEQSHPLHFSDFLLTMGVPVASALRLLELTLDSNRAFGFLFDKVVANSRIFAEESALAISQAVAEVGNSRVRFAPVPFQPENSALAPNPWLFGINADLTLSPQDPVAAQRRDSCNRFELDPFQREGCFRASAGHPNPIGAQMYAAAVIDVL